MPVNDAQSLWNGDGVSIGCSGVCTKCGKEHVLTMMTRIGDVTLTRALHVAGTDRAALTIAIHSIGGDLKWTEVEPGLEDAFIHMLSVKVTPP